MESRQRGDFMKDKATRYFYCYSERMKRALMDNGFYYIETGYNRNSNKPYWVFEGTEELNYYKDFVYQSERDNY